MIKPCSTVAAVFCLPFCPFPLFEKSMTNFKQSKEKEKVSLHWCLNDKLNWQEGTESRQRGKDTTECLCTCIMHVHFQSHVHRHDAHASAPHLPRYQNTISPDKLECVRACRFLTLQVSVTFLSELHVGFASRQRNPKWTHMSSPSLFLSLPVCPLLFLSPLGIVEWSRNMEQKSTSHAA